MEGERKKSFFDVFSLRKVISIALLLPVLFILGNYNLDIFHFICEIVIVMLLFSIAIVTISTSSLNKNHWYRFLGIGFSIVVIFQLFHLVLSNEFSLIKTATSDLSYFFDIAESYVGSSTIVLFLALNHRNIDAKKLTLYYLLLPISLLLMIRFGLLSFLLAPNAYGFNRVGEISVICINMISLVIIQMRKGVYSVETCCYLGIGVIFDIYSKIFLLINLSYGNVSYILYHYFKVLANFMVYEIILKNTLLMPVKLLNDEIYKQNLELISSEKIIRERERVYRNVIEKIPIPLYLSKDHKVEFANESMIRLLKKDPKDSLIGMDVRSIVHPSCLEDVLKATGQTEPDNPLIAFPEKIIDFSNNTLDVELTCFPIESLVGRLRLVLLTDMTAVKKSEAMAVALKEAKENERLYSEYFANLSHEFRTPINVIYSSSQMIDMYSDKGAIEKMKDYNDIIKQNCYRISKLVNNIIDSSRISEGFYNINQVMVDFVSLVEDTVTSVVPYLQSHNVEIIFDTEEEELFLYCDPDKIERIILNLLSNAVKCKKDGPGKIEVNIYRFSEDYLELSIKDNGKGIPKEKISTLFSRFMRVDKSFTRTQEGSGLGLYIVKSLVELHKGEISVHSEEGVGTDMRIKLPIIVKDEEINEDKVIATKSIDEKVRIEFSDVYL